MRRPHLKAKTGAVATAELPRRRLPSRAWPSLATSCVCEAETIATAALSWPIVPPIPTCAPLPIRPFASQIRGRTLGWYLSLRPARLDALAFGLSFCQRSQHANRLPCKCLGFALIVQAVDRLLAPVVLDIFRAESCAHARAAILVAPHRSE